jgi:hypothetical protein
MCEQHHVHAMHASQDLMQPLLDKRICRVWRQESPNIILQALQLHLR